MTSFPASNLIISGVFVLCLLTMALGAGIAVFSVLKAVSKFVSVSLLLLDEVSQLLAYTVIRAMLPAAVLALLRVAVSARSFVTAVSNV